jgi:glycolate oxidase
MKSRTISVLKTIGCMNWAGAEGCSRSSSRSHGTSLSYDPNVVPTPLLSVGPELVSQLRRIVGADHVLTAAGELAVYSRDATPMFSHSPDVVVLPATTAEVSAVLKAANAARVPVIPRGAGTNLAAATVPSQGGLVLALTRMGAIKEISKAEMLAVVEPGVTTATLAKAASALGLMYPPDPGSHTVSTLGGNVAMNAGGLRGLKYGVTRNYVLGLEVVLASGEVIRTGGRLWKDVAGYDLTRLMTGSEGTLGVITEITVGLLPAPATSVVGWAYFPSLESAGDAVASVIAAGIMPATMEFLDQVCINAVEDYAAMGLERTAKALLIFGDDGDEGSVQETTKRIAEIAAEHGGTGIRLASSPVEAGELLYARRCSLPSLARKGAISMLEDVSVPRPMIAEMVRRIEAASQRHAIMVATFGHAGDGNLHPTAIVDADTPENRAALIRLFDDIFSAALELGGSITGEHGVGLAKLPWLEKRLGAEQMALLRRIKHAFDPEGILNPGLTGSA